MDRISCHALKHRRILRLIVLQDPLKRHSQKLYMQRRFGISQRTTDRSNLRSGTPFRRELLWFDGLNGSLSNPFRQLGFLFGGRGFDPLAELYLLFARHSRSRP